MRLTKSSVSLSYHFGGLLEDPNGAFSAGSSKFGRWLSFREAAEVDAATVREFTRKAIMKLPCFKENWKKIQAGTRV